MHVPWIRGSLTAAVAALFVLVAGASRAQETSASSEIDFEPYVGWYDVGSGDLRLATWSATEGLKFFRLGGIETRDDILSERLVPSDDERWEWRRVDADDVLVDFEMNDEGRAIGFRWTEPDGSEGAARRAQVQPSRQELLRYRSGDVELEATLHLPAGSGPYPCAVIIHGSGESHRDSYWYTYQVHHLVRRGVAVVLPDKRGCGRSTGSWERAALQDFAGDTLAAVHALRNRPEIDPSSIGLMGISQGGWVAPIAAAENDDVAFVVNVSGAAVTPGQQLDHEILQDIKSKHVPGFLARLFVPIGVGKVKDRREIWWKKNKDFDPMPEWAKVAAPVLVIYGEEDERDNMPVKRCLELFSILDRPKGSELTLVTFGELGHALISAETGWIAEDYLTTLSDWILSKTAVDRL